MNNKTAVLIGATGLTGSHLLELLQNDPEISLIKVLVRRPLAFSNPKIITMVTDFTDHESFRSGFKNGDMVFCSVGTTNRKVKGDKKEYEKIDYEIPVNAALFSQEAGCSRFAFVSSVGANSSSRNFYLRLKGKVEDTISRMNIPAVLIFRPSFLLGKRKEFRAGELIGKIFIRSFAFLLPSHMKPIRVRYVAQSMLEAARQEPEGIRIFHYREMKQLINKQSL